jgi:threonine dehydrogenase-like Zn-dependent dehydrogenase
MADVLATRVLPASAPAPRFAGGGVIDVSERAVPVPGRGELLVAVRANALCGTDLELLAKGSEFVPGHELAGTVALAGPGTGSPVGVLGVAYLMDHCGECSSCRAGATNLCRAKRGDVGFTRDGGLGAFVLVHETQFFPVGEGLDAAQATLLLDVMGTSGHALARAALVRPSIKSVLVTGAGPVGLGVLAMSKLVLGASTPVAVADSVPYRLALVAELGGLPIDIREADTRQGLQRHGLRSVDVAIDASGKSAARQACLDALDIGGVLVCVGHGESLVIDVSRQLIAPERSLLGSEYFPFGDLEANLGRLREHLPYLAPIITHRLPADRVAEAYRLFSAGETGKVVVERDPAEPTIT